MTVSVRELIEALEAVLESAELSGQSSATYYVSYSAMDKVRAALSGEFCRSCGGSRDQDGKIQHHPTRCFMSADSARENT